ncbi:MAG: hypothetical protein KAI24_05860, partial [Planctomycetes bacterium]|nr:hypothetical protein [Planctomycetota bacterium]
MRTLLSSLFVLSLLPAQQDPAAPTDALTTAGKKLSEALTRTAAQAGTAFELQWGPQEKEKQPDMRVIGNIFGPANGKVTGSWHDDLLHVVFDNDAEDQLLLVGGRMLARDATHEWRRRRGRFADGNQVHFVADPQALLQQLGGWQLAVTRRGAGSFEDRPVEVISVTLNAEQVAELFWSGALPPGLQSGGAMFANMIRIGNAGQRPAPPIPTLTLDLAIAIDPGSGTVYEIRGNSWVENNGNRNIFVLQGGAAKVQLAGGDDDDDADD